MPTTLVQDDVPTPEPCSAPGISVVICAYTERRWGQLERAVRSVQTQAPAPLEVVVVVDHNDGLLERARDGLDGAVVVPSVGPRGLSGARNSGVQASRGEIVAFLDDDAFAAPGWLAALVAPYEEPSVAGVGGLVVAELASDRPAWFPAEFDWVLGCSYRGLPEVFSPVRNFIGANMSFRRSAFEAAGLFTTGVGRIGSVPLGCEETELAIRIRQRWPGAQLVYVPDAVVHHQVAADRMPIDYFVRRCFAEGVSKATIAAMVGAGDATSSERAYVSRTLPSGAYRYLTGRGSAGRTPSAAGALLVGLSSVALGYGAGRVGLAKRAVAALSHLSSDGVSSGKAEALPAP